MKKTLAPLCVLLSLLAASQALGAQKKEPFLRLDRDSPALQRGSSFNLRLLAPGGYRLAPAEAIRGLDPSFSPSLKGLDALGISGSAQFSEPQFRSLAERLRAAAGGRQIWIVDLRQESHGFAGGLAVSWCGRNNQANLGLGPERVQADEEARLAALAEGPATAFAADGSSPGEGFPLEVRGRLTERALAESEGFGYLRIAAPDHLWPPEDQIDAFFAFLRAHDPGRVWLHFHCQAGKGRTAVFMSVVDMIRNPDVPLEDIAARQAMAGGSYLLRYDPASGDGSAKKERAAMTRLMYEYVRETRATDFSPPWSVWLKRRRETEPAPDETKTPEPAQTGSGSYSLPFLPGGGTPRVRLSAPGRASCGRTPSRG